MNLYDDETCYNHFLNWDYTYYDNATYTDGTIHLPDNNGDYYDYDYSNNNNFNNHSYYNSDVEFCAGHYDVKSNNYTAYAGACKGDSGGPLGRELHIS